MQALKRLLHGAWLRPPAPDVPQQEIDVARIGVYTPLNASKRTCQGGGDSSTTPASSIWSLSIFQG
jgi:hypothetical protein